MKRKLSLTGLLGALMIAAIFGGMADAVAGPIAGGLAFGGTLLYAAVKCPSVPFGAAMGIQVEIWQNHIEGNLFKNNEVLLRTLDASQYVLEGKIVHIPQAGSTPGISKNRSVLPATVNQRTDTDVTYQLDQYTTDPFLINEAEKIESSYDKRESILMEHESALRDYLADNLLVNWCPSGASRIIRTTGAATATTLTGTTGNRMLFGTKDLKKAQLTMNKQKIPMEGRVALMSADMFQQLTDDMTITQYRDFSASFDAKEGKLGRLFGFDVYMRYNVASYTNAGTPVVNAYGAVANVDDNDVCLCWQESKIERAVGSIIFREHLNSPTYYGDIYALEVRMGGRKRRTNEEGLVAIVQAAA